MLILLPPSRTMTPVRRGKPLDPDSMSFSQLAGTRAVVLDALTEVSGKPDAVRHLGEPPSLAEVVRRNIGLRAAPTAPAERVYSGVLYDALGLQDLDAASRRRARAWIVILSALWGAVRLPDRIPPYRLQMCGRLPGLGHLPQVWQAPLAEVLPQAVGRGLIVDCRSAEYLTAWRPTGALAERTVTVKVYRDQDGARRPVSHNAKLTRGLLVRRILTDGVDSRRPEALAEALSAFFEVELRAPRRAGAGHELHVAEQSASRAA